MQRRSILETGFPLAGERHGEVLVEVDHGRRAARRIEDAVSQHQSPIHFAYAGQTGEPGRCFRSETEQTGIQRDLVAAQQSAGGL